MTMECPTVPNVVPLAHKEGLKYKVHIRLIILTVLLSRALFTKRESNGNKVFIFFHRLSD